MFARMLQRFARLVRTADLFSLCLAVGCDTTKDAAKDNCRRTGSRNN